MRKTGAKADIASNDRAAGRERAIVRTAARLFAAQGYKATTMDALADACGINKGTLYYYYPSKADILLEISLSVRRELDPLSRAAEKAPKSLTGLIIFATGVLEIANRDRDSFAVYFRESAHFEQYLSEAQYSTFKDSERTMMKIVYGILNRGMYSDELVECDVRYVGRLFVFMVLSVARWPEPQIDIARVVHTIETGFLSGFLKVKPS